MAIEYDGDCARLIDVIEVTDADALLGWASTQSHPRVDLAACSHLHAANLQVLMAAGAEVVAWPADPAWRGWLQQTLNQSTFKQD